MEYFFQLTGRELGRLLAQLEPLSPDITPSPEITQTSFLAEFFYMLLMLGLLITLVLFATHYLRRLTANRMEALNTTSEIKILERRNLSQRSLIYLVEIENRKFMIVENPSALTSLEVAPLENNQYNNHKNDHT